jgi:hypothetical protein
MCRYYKYFWTFLLWCVINHTNYAQNFGHEWTNPAQTYAKVRVFGAEGMFRITYDELRNVGFPVETTNPRLLQVFHMGKEMAIRVIGEEDNKFDRGDYIEFYGKGNINAIDNELFDRPEDNANPYISPYDFLGYYFVTALPFNSGAVGKRMPRFYQSDTNMTPETGCTQELLYVPDNQYNRPVFPTGFPITITYRQDFGAFPSHFFEGKSTRGNATLYRSGSPTVNINFGLADALPTTKVDMELTFVGAVNLQHEASVSAGVGNLRSIGKTTFQNYRIGKFFGSVDSIRTTNGTATFTISVQSTSTDRHPDPSVAVVSQFAPTYYKIKYRQGFNLGQNFRLFTIDENLRGSSRVLLRNVATGTRFYDVTDPYNIKIIGADSTADTRSIIVPETWQKRVILAENRLMQHSGIELLPPFKRFDFSRFDYYIITHKGLRQPVGGVQDPVQAYADYRQQTGYNPIVMDIQEIFNQFGYGFFNPLAVRKFLNLVSKGVPNQPRYLLLIGQGTDILFFRRSGAAPNYIPPFGTAPSDAEFSNGLNGQNRFVPDVPAGRIPAKTPADVLAYLNKVKEHEALPYYIPWRKNILHLSGGLAQGENLRFKSFVDMYKNIAESSIFGASVKTIQKTTTNEIETVNISRELNEGVSLITLFGHSSPEFTDVEIGVPNTPQAGYNNKGRYPMIIQNGCQTNFVFSPNATANSEQWILTPDKGAILYLAMTGLGFDTYLHFYTQAFYENAFKTAATTNQTIGEIMQNTIRQYLGFIGDEIAISHAQQFLLLGDPAIVPFGKRGVEPLPDYAVDDSKLFIKTFSNEPLNATVDSFQLCAVVSNYGITSRQPLSVFVRRTLPDFTVQSYEIKPFTSPKNTDTLCYTIKIPKEQRQQSTGLNLFEFFINYDNSIQEGDYRNNSAKLSINLKRATLLALSPKEYSIVSQQPVYFVAQNTDAFTRERTYRFQMDTSYLFNSSFRKDTVVTGYITAQWTTNLLPNVPANDSTVYYWRVKYAEPRPEDDTTWINSSFVYIRNSPSGWSQSRFPQFTKATRRALNLDVPRKRWSFGEIVNNIDIKAVGSVTNWQDYYIRIDGETYASFPNCFYANPSFPNSETRFLMVAIDAQTGKIYNPFLQQDTFDGYTWVCGASSLCAAPWAVNGSFADVNPIYAYYINNIKQGDYVVMIGTRFAGFQGWRDVFWNAMTQMGLDRNTTPQKVPNGTPFIYVLQKGARQPIVERIGTVGTPITLDNYQLRRNPYEGNVISTLIGPSTEWGNVFRNINGAENPREESWQLNVEGIDFSNNATTLYNNIRPDAFDIRSIDAKNYPYLRLNLSVKDSIRRTPYQLQRWQVIYKEVPEGILLYDTLSYRENTVLEFIEGDSVKIKFNFLNISGTDFPEPLKVQYFVRNLATGKDTTFTQQLSGILKRETFQNFALTLPSLNFKGDNLVRVFVNPRIIAEQLYDNNLLEARFKVKPDDINPVLDVAIDGKHLINGDIVRATPTLQITLKDENKFLFKQDTTGIDILLKRGDATFRRINFNDPNLIWTPASTANGNKFTIEYRSPQLENGTYTLLVQGKDVTGNLSGKNAYQITFKVINETTVSNFYPYPNPFSTNTRFVFTLTGDIPEQIRIQIMTITGKVVKTLYKEDLGALRIGTNMTEYAWDGTDEFGDKLANGVYLYKVDIRSQGKEYKHSATAGDDLFKNGYGKMYLMR